MKGNLRKVLLTSSLLICVAVVLVMGGIGTASPETVVTVDQKIYEAAPGESFNVTITVTDVADLYSYDVNMTFNPAVLNCTGVTEGPFLETAGTTWWLPTVIRNDKGYVLFGNSLFIPPPPEGATGNGVLANVTFKVLAEGTTSLHFSMTALNTLEEGISQPIQHTAVDGTFTYPIYHDVAVTNVSFSPASVQAGETVSINVTVRNEGNATETFDVTISYDSTEIESKTASDLAPGDSETLAFSWNTGDVNEGNYTITATASTVSGETEIEDNTNSEVTITVTAPLPSLIPVELIVGITIVLVVAIVLIFLYARRRRPAKA